MAKIETLEQAQELYEFYLKHKKDIYLFIDPKDEVIKRIMCGFLPMDHPEWFADIIWIDGKVAGGVIGYIAKNLFTDTVVAREAMVYLLPEYRDTKGSVLVVKAWDNFEEWAKKSGAKFITVDTYGEYKEHAIRKGFKETTTSFFKEYTDGE